MSIKTKVFGLVVLASAMAFAGPVSHFGRLVACGKNICGEKTGTSTPIQVKGLVCIGQRVRLRQCILQ